MDELVKWSETWQLKFHPDKCSVMKLGPSQDTEYFMTVKDKDGKEKRVKLKEIEAEKDLGVIIDKSLSFKQHVQQAKLKANRVLGMIRRSFDHLSEGMLVQLFKGLIRPILEYGHSVWNLDVKTQKGLCAELESVQRAATRMLAHLKSMPYHQRLARLQLPSLEHRRRRGDAIEVYKYLRGYYQTTHPELCLDTNKYNTRGHSLKLEKQRFKTSVRGKAFANRVINDWNSLPEEVISAPSLNTFKNRLDRHWANLPTVYRLKCLE